MRLEHLKNEGVDIVSFLVHSDSVCYVSYVSSHSH